VANTARELFKRFVTAMNDQDFAALEAIIHPDVEGDFPQSRERFRGFAAFRTQLENYPGGLLLGGADPDSAVLLGDDDRWIVTPGYTVLPLAGADRYTTVVRTTYPDGSAWHVIGIIEISDGLIYRITTYFAPEYEQPEWRRGLTERY
jgi:hypothetical protein